MASEETRGEEKKKSVFAKGGTDEEKTQRLMAGGAINMALTLAGGLLLAVWQVCMTRMLGPQNFGIFNPSFQTIYIVLAVITLQIHVTINVFVSHHWQTEPEESRKYIIVGMKLLGFLSCVTTAIIIAGTATLYFKGKMPGCMTQVGLNAICHRAYSLMALPWNSMYFKDRMTSYMALMWVFYGLAILVSVIFWGINSSITGFQRLDYTAYGNFANPVGMMVFSIGGVVLVNKLLGPQHGFTIAGAMFGVLMGAALALITAMYFFKSASDGAMSLREIFTGKRFPGLAKKILVFGGVTAIATVAMNLVNFTTPILVSVIANKYRIYAATLADNRVRAGYFAAAFNFSVAAMMIMGITVAIMPAISEAQSQKREDLMQKFYALCMKYSFLLAIGVATMYITVGGAIATVMSGPEYPYPQMRPLVAVCGAGMSAYALLFVVTNILFSIKRPAVSAVIACIATGIEVGLIFIISFAAKSITPVAWAIFAASLFGILAALVYIQFKTPMKLPAQAILAPGMAGVVTWTVVRFLLPQWGGNLMLVVVVNLPLMVFIYSMLLFFFGCFDAGDLEQYGAKGDKLAWNMVVFKFLVTKSPFYRVWNKKK